MMLRKRYTMDLNTLMKLGEGKTAEVFALDEARALKLYLEGFQARDAETEYACGILAQRCGVPVPRMLEYCLVNGRHGLIMERIDGQSMLEPMLKAGPEALIGMLGSFAAIHRSMLEIHAPDAPACKQRLAYQLERSGNNRFLPHLHALPDGDRLCHGDFHPGNVLMCQGKPYVIDLMSCCKGAPVLDIARTYYLMSYGALDLIDASLHREIGAQYLQAMGIKLKEIAPALPVVMAARLSESPIEPERAVIMDHLRDLEG